MATQNPANKTTANKTTANKAATNKAATNKATKLAPAQKLQANKAKADSRDAFISMATTGTLPKLSTMKGTMSFEPAKKITDFLDRWIMILAVRYVVVKNPQYGEGDSMLCVVVDRDGKKSEVWASDTFRNIIETHINDETMTLPTVTKIIRPGRAFVPTSEDAPADVIEYFEKWIAVNGLEVRIDATKDGDIPF